MLDAAQAAAAERAAAEIGLEPHSVFTYLANALEVAAVKCRIRS